MPHLLLVYSSQQEAMIAEKPEQKSEGGAPAGMPGGMGGMPGMGGMGGMM